MNTVAQLFPFLFAALIAFYALLAEHRSRRVALQLKRLIAHHEDLRHRFGKFMIVAGHELVKANIERVNGRIPLSPEIQKEIAFLSGPSPIAPVPQEESIP